MKKNLPGIVFGVMVTTLIALFCLMITFGPANQETKKTEQAEEENPKTEQTAEDSQEQESEDESSKEDKNQGENESEKENSESEDSGYNEDKKSDESNDNEKESTQQFYWGVDSASYTDENIYACVVDNFGKPEIWGRYLSENESVSAGIDQKEIDFLHNEDIQILVIYNHVTDARGYDNGVEHGNSSISMAEDFGIPEDVALFVDIEPDYPVDTAFIEGWYDALIESIYEPAIYGVFDEGSKLSDSFLDLTEEIQENTIVWTAFPQEEITSKDNAPEFNPTGPENSKLFGWQYAIDAETCNIDTNLFTDEMLDYTW